MTQALETERRGLAPVSRRALLQAGIATTVATTCVGRIASALADPAIEPFSYRAPQSALDDLRQRLAQARWPERETVADWSQGVPLEQQRALVDYWRTDYDWRRFEARLNGFDQYRTAIDDLDIHFLHVRSPHVDALPLIITHGWPGSIIEFFEIIEPLADPTAHGGEALDAFHVIAPSLPGFGFSGKPAEPGWNSARIARAWGELMGRLGYSRYVAQGGDWGAEVTTRMAQQQAPGLAAIHLNFPLAFPDPLPTTGLSAEEQRAVDALTRFQTDGSGYFLQQSTRPQTVGYALVDSPVGQAAWIYEKFHAWTDHDGDLEDALSRDAMLDTITLYWLTGTAASSARIYFENVQAGLNSGTVDHVPVGCSLFPGEIFPTPRSWAEQYYADLFYWNELDRGGHFAAFEEPALFTQELRKCFRAVR